MSAGYGIVRQFVGHGIGRQMQIGEENLALAEHLALDRLDRHCERTLADGARAPWQFTTAPQSSNWR